MQSASEAIHWAEASISPGTARYFGHMISALVAGRIGGTRESFPVATGALVGASERWLCELGCTGKEGRFRSHPLGRGIS
jgi:hypothetical protein